MGPEGIVCEDYNDLIAAFIERRHDLGLTQIEIDYISGLQEGYTGKIESWKHKTSGKGVGFLTLPLLLHALGVVIVVKPLAEVTAAQVLPLKAPAYMLPKEHYWVRVAPAPAKKALKPLAKAGKAVTPAAVQRPRVPSRKPAAPPQGQRKPSGSGSKPRRPRAAGQSMSSQAPC